MNMIQYIENTKKDIQKSISVLKENLDRLDAELAELKKEAEVKLVFPNHGNSKGVVWGLEGNKPVTLPWENDSVMLSKIGLTFYSEKDAQDDLKRQEARAYIIEEINKANYDWGGNGFKPRCFNHKISFNHDTDEFYITSNTVYQSGEDKLYIRDKEQAKKLLSNNEFTSNCRLYYGIES